MTARPEAPGPRADTGSDGALASWDGSHYAEHTAHHREHDDVVIDAVRGLPADASVVDIGCGAGDFTVRLVDDAGVRRVLGIDADPSMVATASRRWERPGLSFRHAPAQHLASVVDAGSIDAVVSTACLHWVPEADHPSVLRQVREVLVPGGFLRAEFGGAGQLAEVREVMDAESRARGGGSAPWFFPTAQGYAELVEQAGLVPEDVALVRQMRALPDLPAMEGWLTSQVLLAYRDGLPDEEWVPFQRSVIERLAVDLRRPDGRYDVEYVRLVVTARR